MTDLKIFLIIYQKKANRIKKLKTGKIVMKLNMIKNCILEDGTFGNLKLSYTIKYFKLPFIVEKVHIDKLDVLPKEYSSSHLSMYIWLYYAKNVQYYMKL